MYFQEVFGLLYLNPSWTSESNDVLSCNDLVETFEYPSLVLPEGWVRAKIRGKEGHIPAAFLATTKATCFAQKYPKFFDRFNLSATERFYFGRLYGRYHWGNSATP
jgi:hypothetical protein